MGGVSLRQPPLSASPFSKPLNIEFFRIRYVTILQQTVRVNLSSAKQGGVRALLWCSSPARGVSGQHGSCRTLRGWRCFLSTRLGQEGWVGSTSAQALVRNGEAIIKIEFAFLRGGGLGGREKNILQKAVSLGKRHDKKTLKVQILLSRNSVVIAQAPS